RILRFHLRRRQRSSAVTRRVVRRPQEGAHGTVPFPVRALLSGAVADVVLALPHRDVPGGSCPIAGRICAASSPPLDASFHLTPLFPGPTVTPAGGVRRPMRR